MGGGELVAEEDKLLEHDNGTKVVLLGVSGVVSPGASAAVPSELLSGHTAPSVPLPDLNGQRFPLCSPSKQRTKLVSKLHSFPAFRFLKPLLYDARQCVSLPPDLPGLPEVRKPPCFYPSQTLIIRSSATWERVVRAQDGWMIETPFIWSLWLEVLPSEFLALSWNYLKANGTDLYKLFTTGAQPLLRKLGCRSKDCFDVCLAYLFNLASDSAKCTSFLVICRVPFIPLSLVLASDLSTFCI